MTCNCHEERCVPIALVVPYMGISADDGIMMETVVHAVMCWSCGTLRILDKEQLKKIATENGKVMTIS